MNKLKGTGVALVTPFNEDLEIDEDSLRRLVAYMMDGKVDFLVVLGTTAECATLNAAEKERVVRIVVEENKGRLPLVAGIGGNDTASVIREIRSSGWLKDCEGILSITPYYNKPSQEGLYAHFKAIAEVSPLPLCLYNVPGRTGVNMHAATLTRLAADCPNIIAVKEASGDFGQATEILKNRHAGFSVLSGDDAIVLPLMAMGFDGVISVAANVMPGKCAWMTKRILAGDYKEAQSLHLQLSGLCKLLFREGNPAGVKAALHAAGIIRHNTLRLPLSPVSDSLYREIAAEVEKVRLH